MLNSYEQVETMKTNETEAPKYLYKVVAIENWEESHGQKEIKLAKDDAAFIHLSTKDQLGRIIEKYWSKAPGYVVLKVETKKLHGKLLLEANPGGTNQYYHLYDGSIPLDAVVDSETVKP